jgi:adenosylcobinamide-GDP ribazoletransferase
MVKNIIAAFRFLTILPIPVKCTQKNLEKSIVWFPFVGAIIGLITGYGYRLLHVLFSTNISAVLTILLYILLTRGLHLDGLMDTLDGFLCHKGNKEDILRVMKDPAVGSFALLGGITWFFLLFSIIPRLEPWDYIIIHTYTRLSILLQPLIFSYPRESGTGKFFVDHINGKIFSTAMVLSLLITAAAVYFLNEISSESTALIWGLLLLTAFLCSLLIGIYSKKKISGITGDILGFTIEINHLILALLILILVDIFGAA